jgi:uncharacterized surface protein with fasciclin (FAS1) repeats
MIRRMETYRSLAGVIMMALILVTGCKKEQFDDIFFEEEELLISDYLEAHADRYGTLIQVLELTGLKSTLNAYGHYTFFAPDDDAFEKFLEESGISSVEELDPDYLTTLVKYHLLNIEIESSYFRDGVIQDTTLSGDHLVVTFSAGGLETIMVNDAMIIERDVYVENGILHRLDGVLDPIVGSLTDRLQGEGIYSVFCDALEMTGLGDSLDVITIQVSEEISYRSRFTLFVESDETYASIGINDVQDLVDRYSDSEDLTDKNNGFYMYMAYHIIPDLLFLNDLDTFNYPTLAANKLINVSIDNDILLYQQGGEEAGEHFIRVIPEASNRQAKNGTYHEIDQMLELSEPPPVYLVIDLTNYQGISLGREYTEKELEDIRGIRTENTGIYFRNSILSDGETNLQTTEVQAGWSVEFTIPPIVRGKYDVYFHWASYPTNTNWAQAFWDGARLGDTFSFEHQKRWPGQEWKRDFNTSQYLGRLVLTVTEEHTIRFASLMDGYGVFDYLVLVPIND